MSPLAIADITGLVLAGGRGSRMGGIDKGLQAFRGRPLALHALERLRAQVGRVAINANRNLAAYEAFGVPVWPDALPDQPGPLAGFLAGLAHCETPWLLAVPCDTPMFPRDLAARLAAAAAAEDAEIAIAAAPDAQGDDAGASARNAERDGGDVVTLRPQPVFCLLRADLKDSLRAFVESGHRKVGQWTASHRLAVVPFDRPGDAPDAFFNANTLAELQALEGNARERASVMSTDAPSLSVDAVQVRLTRLSEQAVVRQVETVALRDAIDRVLSEDIVSPVSVPPHDNSAMDGFAFDGALLPDSARSTRRPK